MMYMRRFSAASPQQQQHVFVWGGQEAFLPLAMQRLMKNVSIYLSVQENAYTKLRSHKNCI